ncbi:MAG TPA: transglycosylase domain-containing protein, partial [Aggregatilineaceae bacterium]|nr:transglycosylase domain-containing protein [Aggregatilineaceae bacterium]
MRRCRWYSYDGREWKVGVPMGYDAPDIAAPVQNAVPTETGMQQVVADAIVPDDEGVIKPIRIELDEDGLPLPARVPQTDPGATLVSPGSPFLEPVRRSEAPTQTHSQQVTPGSEMIARPDQEQMTQPARPEAVAGQTMRSPVTPDTMASPGIPVPQRTQPGEEATIPSMSPSDSGAAVAAPIPAEKAKYKLGEYPQPDYSAALGFSHNRRTYIKWGMRVGVFGVIFGMALTLCVLLGMVGYYFYVVSEYRDIVSNLDERASKFETSEIYDANGKLLAKFDDPNQGTRESVPLDQISPWLIDATIATENETFYTDPGFSVFAIVRAAYQNLQSGSTVSGASTITQQLARALVLEKDFAQQISAERKINEIIVASEIKRQYSKNQILEIYLNEIFYANRAYGIEAASQVYFGKSAAELNPAEAAFLAGLPQSPATYDPVLNREAAMLRMNDVLFLMAEANGTGCVTIQHEDKTPWGVPNGGGLCIIAQTAADGSIIYYYQTPGMEAPEEMTLMIAQVQTAQFSAPTLNVTHPHFVNYVWQQLEAEYGAQAIYTAGYRVYTTLDETIQAAAEKQVTDTLNDINTRLAANANNASVVVMRPADGAVLAMVGSADYNNEDIDGQVNVAFTAQQPGSSIKPIVYLAAFEPTGDKYMTPGSALWDVYSNFNGYIPTNFDLRYRGPVSVRYALGNSLNVPAVKTLNYIGVEDFTDMAYRAHLQFP